MRKTAPDGESAGELPEVTTEAHSQPTQTTEDSKHSLEDRDSTAGSQQTQDGAEERSALSPETEARDLAGRQSRPPSAASAQDDESELDFDQAERFAASFRPSWEPDQPGTPMIPPAQFVGTSGGAPRVIRSTTRGDLTAPKLRKHRGSAYAILGASLLGVGGLLYMAIASSSVRPEGELAASAETGVGAMGNTQPTAAVPAPVGAAANPQSDPNASGAATDPNAQTALDPNAQAALDPNAQAALDPNAQAALDPNAHTALDPNAQAALDPNAHAALDPNAVPPGTNADPNAAVNPNSVPAGTDPAAAAAANANPNVAADPNAVPAGTNPNTPVGAQTDPNAAAQAVANPGAVPAGTSPNANAIAAANPNAVPAGTDPNANAAANRGAVPAGTSPNAIAAANPNAVPAGANTPAAQAAANPNAVRAGTNANGAAPNAQAANGQADKAQAGVPDIKTPGAALAAAAKPGATPAPALPSPQPSAAPKQEHTNKVVLSLAAYPPNARLKLDGAPIENPFRGRLPRSSKHRIEARAPGFAPEVHSVRLENDVQLMISLKREPPSNVKADPYRDQRRTAAAPSAPTRNRGAGFVAENPY